MLKPCRNLKDSYDFWLAVSTSLLTLGLALASAPVALPAKMDHWVTGALRLAGAIGIAWGVILFIACKVAGDLRCPDPGLHRDKSQDSAPKQVTPVSHLHKLDNDSLRSVLRDLKFDLRDAATRIEKARATNLYWQMTGSDGGVLMDRVWNKNRRKLSILPGIGDLYEALRVAFADVERVNRIQFSRAFDGSSVRPGDDLPCVLLAIHEAEVAVEKQLAELG